MIVCVCPATELLRHDVCDRCFVTSEVVNVEVLAVRPSGLLVNLPDGDHRGYIRRRELSWDRRIGAEIDIPRVGDRLRATIIPGRENDRYIALSVRQLRDPWREIKGKYRVGQPVWGEVVDIRDFGGFVQIEPGVDAIVRPCDIPMLRHQTALDVLSIGDQVMGVITKLDLDESRFEMNLIEWLRQLSTVDFEERRSIQLVLFREAQQRRKTDRVLDRRDISGDQERRERRRFYPPLSQFRGILVIDDESRVLESITSHLEEAYDVPVIGVHKGDEALREIRKERAYDVAVVDLRLKGESGLEVSRSLLVENPELAFVFMSKDPVGRRGIPRIYGQRFPFAHKDLESISAAVSQLLAGYWEESDDQEASEGGFMQHLGMEVFARRPISEVLNGMLSELRQRVKASQSFVLEVDSANREVEILAADPPLEDVLHKASLDGLYYSPARSVIEEQEEFYASYIDQDADDHFKNFFRLLRYRSCLGIPIQIPDLTTRHALFLLNEGDVTFGPQAREDARLTALLMRSALERSLLLDYMRRYEQRYTLGQLLGSLVHELKNKMEALKDHSLILPEILRKVRDGSTQEECLQLLSEADEIAIDIKRSSMSLNGILEAYARLVSGEQESVDVNTAVEKVKRNLVTKAGESQVGIYIDAEPDMPPARAIGSRLEQAVTNLVLNGIQQIERQRQFMKNFAREKGLGMAVLQKGQVIIQTRFDRERRRPIQISVFDTGPGIHYDLQQRLFQVDMSVRKRGHGLGLFISRDLIENMGGRIYLVDSLIFIGSLFRIELPVNSDSEGA